MYFQFKAGRTPHDVYLTSVIVLQLFFDRNYKLWTLPFSFKAPILATMCVYLPLHTGTLIGHILRK